MTDNRFQEEYDRLVWLIASMLDHPSVFMGGPSERNKRRARDVVDAMLESGWTPPT